MKLRSKFLPILAFLIVCALSYSCNNLTREKIVDKTKLLGYDFRLFQNTKYWNIAKAVQDGDLDRIKQFAHVDKELIDAQEPRFKGNLLMFTIWHQDYETFRCLLELGADVNIHDSYNGESAILLASKSKRYDIKYVVDLLKYGANPSDVEVGVRPKGNTTRMTPLMNASEDGNIELVRLLLDSGAQINYKNEYNQTALERAVGLQRCEVILYLLQNGADFNYPFGYNEVEKRYSYIDEHLRYFLVDLYSKDWEYKMAIVDFLKKRGVDYKKVPLPAHLVELIKRRYPYNWQEYIENY